MYETMYHVSFFTCRQSPKRNPTAPWSPGRGGERRCNLFYWQPFSSIFLQFLYCFYLLNRCSHSSWQPSARFLPTSSPKQAPRSIHLFPRFTILARSFFTFLSSRQLFSLHLNPILLWVPSLLPHHIPGWFLYLSFSVSSKY